MVMATVHDAVHHIQDETNQQSYQVNSNQYYHIFDNDL